MDVSLGVSIEGTRARIALVDAAPPHTAVDRSEIDVEHAPVDTVVSTVVSTDRMLTQQGHRLVGTTICDRDGARATILRNALSDSDLTNVVVVPQPDAITEVARSLVGAGTTAALFGDDDTAALSIVDSSADTTSLIAIEPVTGGDRATAYRALLERFREEPGGATSVVVFGAALSPALADELSSTSPVPLTVPERPEFAVAMGAALAGLAAGRRPSAWAPDRGFGDAETIAAPAAQHLAYSEVSDAAAWSNADVPLQTPLQPLSSVRADDHETEEVEEAAAAAPGQSKTLLVGSTVAAVVVVGFAALAVTVAINIRPDVDQQVTRAYDEKVAGKYFPVAPGQGVIADGPAWTVVEHLPDPGTEPEARVFEPKLLGSSWGSGSSSRPQLIEYYRDGTIGMQPVQKASATIPMPAPAAAGAPGVPVAGILDRIVPNFNRWSPCQVIALMANWRLGQEAQTERVQAFFEGMRDVAAAKSSETWAEPVRTESPLSIGDIGDVALVPADKGVLFPTSKDAGATGVDVTAIPSELFTSDTPDSVAAAVLPKDVKIVKPQEVPTAPAAQAPGSVPSLPILGVPADTGTLETLPGVQGTAPVEIEKPTSDSDRATETLPEKEEPETVEVTSDKGVQERETDAAEVPSRDAAPVPPAEAPAPEIDRPAPPADIPPPPVVEAPPAPETSTRVSVPEAPKAPPAPEPVYEAPPAPEPVYQAPPAPEPAPEPVYEAPPAPEPVYEAPAAPAPPPVVQAPPAAPPVTEKPRLPRLIDLFPKRDRSSSGPGSSSGSGSDSGSSPTTTLLPTPGEE